MCMHMHQVDGFMGIIQKECCAAELCEDTAASSAAECRERSGAAPPIEVHANDRSQARTPRLSPCNPMR